MVDFEVLHDLAHLAFSALTLFMSVCVPFASLNFPGLSFIIFTCAVSQPGCLNRSHSLLAG